MNQDLLIQILTQAFYVSFLIILPILGVSLFIGIIISIFQAATSIQEMTLTFAPKILITALVIIFLFPWMVDKMISFTVSLFQILPIAIK